MTPHRDSGLRLLQRAVPRMLVQLTPQIPCVRPWWSTRDAHPPTHQHLVCCSSRDVHSTDSPVPLHDTRSTARRAPPSDTTPVMPATSEPAWLAEDAALTATKQAAVRALNRRSMHSSQLREKLLKRGHPPEAIDTSLEAGILHDGDYAAAFARTAAYSKAWAPSRIRVELRRRGVVRTDIEAALAAALGSGPTADHDCIGTCMALLVERVDAAVEGGEDVQAVLDAAAVDETADGAMRSAAALLRVAHRRWSSTANLPHAKRTTRLSGWLQRRGHGWGLTSSMLAALQRWETG